MVSPRVKFIAITIDELFLVPIAMALAYFFVPDWFIPLTIVLIVGAVVFVVAKYYLVYPSLQESSYSFYEIEGLRGKVIEEVTDSSGKIKVGAEIWDARCDAGSIGVGTEIKVLSRDMMRVIVAPYGMEND
ncbi:MAG: NfeD family protein [Candidatus Thorarchaeota archaeon]|jgi:membrane protein implicated in regulation of membrane protease activity